MVKESAQAGFRIAVVGATGVVGQEILNTLAQRKFPAADVIALASEQSVGRELAFGRTQLQVQALETHDFADTDIALFAAGGSVAKAHAPKAAAARCVVIDNSSYFRMEPDVPLIVPEVNVEALKGFRKRYIIANPNCSTAQLVVVLKPLHAAARITRVVVTTYQSVSGAGRAALDALFEETKSLYTSQDVRTEVFPKPIAFNVIPQIGSFDADGVSEEEAKMRAETKKILDARVELCATCVRVPVFVGHSEAVTVEFAKAVSPARARTLLRAAPGVEVVDAPNKAGYITPKDCVGKDASYVSRVRADTSTKNGLCFWVVSDNLRKGAALNAVQIAEALIGRYLKPKSSKSASKTVAAAQ